MTKAAVWDYLHTAVFSYIMDIPNGFIKTGRIFADTVMILLKNINETVTIKGSEF